MCRTDDIQLYISFQPQDVSKLQILHRRIDSISGWMDDNFLQLNEEKTKVLVCAPDKFVPKIMENLGPLATFGKSSTTDLGVNFESALTC